MTATHDNEKRVHQGESPPPEGFDNGSPINSVLLDKDVAIALVGEHAREIDPAVEAKVLRKIDRFLVHIFSQQ